MPYIKRSSLTGRFFAWLWGTLPFHIGFVFNLGYKRVTIKQYWEEHG